jgi:hypothetical protein
VTFGLADLASWKISVGNGKDRSALASVRRNSRWRPQIGTMSALCNSTGRFIFRRAASRRLVLPSARYSSRLGGRTLSVLFGRIVRLAAVGHKFIEISWLRCATPFALPAAGLPGSRGGVVTSNRCKGPFVEYKVIWDIEGFVLIGNTRVVCGCFFLFPCSALPDRARAEITILSLAGLVGDDQFLVA